MQIAPLRGASEHQRDRPFIWQVCPTAERQFGVERHADGRHGIVLNNPQDGDSKFGVVLSGDHMPRIDQARENFRLQVSQA